MRSLLRKPPSRQHAPSKIRRTCSENELKSGASCLEPMLVAQQCAVWSIMQQLRQGEIILISCRTFWRCACFATSAHLRPQKGLAHMAVRKVHASRKKRALGQVGARAPRPHSGAGAAPGLDGFLGGTRATAFTLGVAGSLAMPLFYVHDASHTPVSLSLSLFLCGPHFG